MTETIFYDDCLSDFWPVAASVAVVGENNLLIGMVCVNRLKWLLCLVLCACWLWGCDAFVCLMPPPMDKTIAF